MAIITSTQIPGPAGVFAPVDGWTSLATAPTVVEAGSGQHGWEFPAGAQSLTSVSFTSSTARRVLDVIVEISAVPTVATEIIQARGAARVVALNLSTSGKYTLTDATTGGTTATGTKGILLGTKHRITLDMDGVNATATIFTNDTGSTVYETLTRTLAGGATAISSFRLGWSTAAGAVLRASWPIQAAAPTDVSGRIYPLPTAVPAGWREMRIYSRT